MMWNALDIAAGIYVVVWLVLTVWMWLDSADVYDIERDGSPLLWMAFWPLWLVIILIATAVHGFQKAERE